MIMIVESDSEEISYVNSKEQLTEFFKENGEQLANGAGEIAVIDFSNYTCEFYRIDEKKEFIVNKIA